MASFTDLPVEVLDCILRKTLIGDRNYKPMKLGLVCKKFKEVMDKMTSFTDLPVDVLELILRKTFLKDGNYKPMKLELVCNKFKEVMDKYYDRCSKTDFVCKGCYSKYFCLNKVLKCENCPYIDFSHSDNCKTKKMRRGGGYKQEYVKKCNECDYLDNKHKKNCKYGKIKVRGIKGFCPSCLCDLTVKECTECGLEFMSLFKGKESYCLSCLPICRPKIKINPEWKEILSTDEPFCY